MIDFRFRWSVLVLCAMLILLSSCTSDDDAPPPSSTDNTEAFAKLLKAQLDGQVMGYAFVIMKEGEVVQKGNGGLSRTQVDGARDMSTSQPMHVASISKFITTIAALRLLEKNNLSPNTKIAPYLPSDWPKGPGIDELTFIELLSHRSGFVEYGTQNFNATLMDSLRHVIALGSAGLKSPRYSNIHHSFFRVILPMLDDKINARTSDLTAIASGRPYEQMLNREVFAPLAVSATLNGTSDVIHAYATHTDATGGSGRFANFAIVSGAYGWHISADDLAKVWLSTWYSEAIISKQMRQAMMESRAGLFNTIERPRGIYYNKIGQWMYSFATQKQVECIAVHYPGNIDLILYVNSAHAQGSNVFQIAIQTYENSLLPG